MTEPNKIDPEQLAALLDGRLDAAAAAALRGQLAASDDETLSVFADAVAVTRALAADAETEAMTRARPRRWSRWVMPPIAAAAAIGAFLVWRPAPYAPAEFANAVPGAPLSNTGPAWGELRGASERVEDAPRAVRVGALLTDIEVRRRNGGSVREPALAVARLLDDASGGSALAMSLRSFANDSTGSSPASHGRDLGRQALDLVDRDRATTGAYLEALRLAAASGDSMLVVRAPPRALEAVRKATATDSDITGAFRGFDERMRSRPIDLAAVQRSTTTLLRALTR